LQPSTLAKRGSVLLFFTLAAFYLYGLGHLPLIGPDEPRYAEVAREMLLRHDLITPTLGGHLWFEKPVLLYWMMIASYKLFGMSEWAARLPAALSGLLTVAAVFCVGRRVEQNNSNGQLRDLGFWSALAAGSSLGIVIFARAASFDIILTMTTTWALAFFLLHELEENAKPRPGLLVGFYAFVGLSLLAKGLVGLVIPLGTVGAYHVFRRTLGGRKTLLSFFWGLPLALGVAATWYVPVIWRHGWPFVDQFFIQHQFARYITNKYHHAAPFYYYLLILIPLSLPWTAFLIAGLLRFRTWDWRANDSVNKLLVFAFAWLLVPLVFFSFSTSKLPGYILPVLPAAALIVGERLSRLNSDFGNSKLALRATAVLCLIIAAVLPVYASRSDKLPLHCAITIAAFLGVAGIFVLLSARRRAASILSIAGTSLAVLLVALHCAAPKQAERQSSRHLIQLADSQGYSQAAIYGIPRDDRTPEFYAAGRVLYGPGGEPVIHEGPSQVIAEAQTRKDVFLVFVPLKELNQLTGTAALQTNVLGNNGRFAIVAVQSR
jgi:4-amino-4-deoxy-L-arabinose transferase-like glycosyltransferase